MLRQRHLDELSWGQRPDGEAFRVRSRAPEAGEHTEEVLLEAGYGWEDIGRWKESGVIS